MSRHAAADGGAGSRAVPEDVLFRRRDGRARRSLATPCGRRPSSAPRASPGRTGQGACRSAPQAAERDGAACGGENRCVRGGGLAAPGVGNIGGLVFLTPCLAHDGPAAIICTTPLQALCTDALRSLEFRHSAARVPRKGFLCFGIKRTSPSPHESVMWPTLTSVDSTFCDASARGFKAGGVRVEAGKENGASESSYFVSAVNEPSHTLQQTRHTSTLWSNEQPCRDAYLSTPDGKKQERDAHPWYAHSCWARLSR